MALDSESRWRLVRAMRAKGTQPTSNETTIRDAKVEDLTQIVEIYNYYIRNSVVTFDLDAMSMEEWQQQLASQGLGAKELAKNVIEVAVAKDAGKIRTAEDII